jgi:hypothetical protein
MRSDVPSPPILSRSAETCAGFLGAHDMKANTIAIMNGRNFFMLIVFINIFNN